jgi:hypothetical protein
MRRHFAEFHPKVKLTIEEEGPLPRCTKCEMFVSNPITHKETELCKTQQK